MTNHISDNLSYLLEHKRQAESANQRHPNSVKLIVVSKQQSVARIREVLALGQYDFGENYLQEALPKITALHSEKIIWHFIGQIQANKTALIAQHFAWVHSVDRLKIAQRLSQARGQANLPPLQVCLQVNALNSAAKHGVALTELPKLVKTIVQLPHLKLRGLMTLPDLGTEQQAFAEVADIFLYLRQMGYDIDVLSMGMSADFAIAIAAGATHIRIGSAIFGNRN